MCINLTVLNDWVVENDEQFQVLVLPTTEDHDVVVISGSFSVNVITIVEDSNDGNYCELMHNACFTVT